MAHINPNVLDLLEFRLEGPRSVAHGHDRNPGNGIADVYVTTGLDDPDLTKQIQEPRYRIIVVLGTPGDGKSRFLKRFENECDARGLPFAVRHDAAFAESTHQDAEIKETQTLLKASLLDRSLTHEEWLGHGKPVVLLGINRGLYDVIFRDRRQPYHWVHENEDHALVLDLARRFPFRGLQEGDIFGALVTRVTDHKYWEDWQTPTEGCGGCPVQNRCPILWNIRMLRDGAVTARLRYELTRVVLTGRQRATLRDIWDYLAHITVIHPDAYVRDNSRYHPCTWIQKEIADIDTTKEATEKDFRRFLGAWRLLPNLAWSAGDDIQFLSRNAILKRIVGHLGGSGSPVVPGIAASLVGKMRGQAPTLSATNMRREFEIQASVDPLGITDLVAQRSVRGTETRQDWNTELASTTKRLLQAQDDVDAAHRIIAVLLDYLIRSETLWSGQPTDRALAQFYAITSLLIEQSPHQSTHTESSLGLLSEHVQMLVPNIGWEKATPAKRQVILRQIRDDFLSAFSRALSASDYTEAAPVTKGIGGGAPVQEIRLLRSGESNRAARIAINIAGIELKLIPPAAGSPHHDSFVDAVPTALQLELKVKGLENRPIHLPIDMRIFDFVESVAGNGTVVHPSRSDLDKVESLDLLKERLRSAASRQQVRTGEFVLYFERDVLAVDEVAQ